MSSSPPPILAATLERLSRQDLGGARAAINAALDKQPEFPPALELAAYIAARTADNDAVAHYNRKLMTIDAGNLSARINLATALVATGALDEAAQVCDGATEPKLRRIAAYLHQENGQTDAAIADYEAVVAAFSDDFQSWNNLGNLRAAAGDTAGAIVALDRAVQLRPDLIQIYFNLSEAFATAEQFASRQRLMREAARRAPQDVRVHVDLGLAEAGMRDYPAAETAFRKAIALSDAFSGAYIELGLLLENLNRIDDLAALIEEADARGIAAPELDFLRAWTLRRRGRVEEALRLAEATPETVHPLRRMQLIGDLRDRIGDADGAFAAFTAMNAVASGLSQPPRGPTYRERIAANTALLTRERVAAWTKVDVHRVPAPPVFIVGFPRSGTTLLDTLLMNVPDVHVLEELPVLRDATERIGDDDAKLATLDSDGANQMRARYFERLAALSPAPPDAIIIDKHPLQMTRMALIHRIFPDAKVVLVQRHPCDAVLSCYMANFQLNTAMRSFVDLEETARVYDAAFAAWTAARSVLPIDAHIIRYEDMIANLEGEMRGLLAFLDMSWTSDVLDNQRSASTRDHIRTASYSQVTEPLYRRAVGRWERYRTHLAPVMPILTPWIERSGYTV